MNRILLACILLFAAFTLTAASQVMSFGMGMAGPCHHLEDADAAQASHGAMMDCAAGESSQKQACCQSAGCMAVLGNQSVPGFALAAVVAARPWAEPRRALTGFDRPPETGPPRATA